MADNRHKDANWRVSSHGDSPTFQGAQLAVLMDIRDELKALNRIFGCHNFLNMPHVLKGVRDAAQRLDKRAAQKRPLKARSR